MDENALIQIACDVCQEEMVTVPTKYIWDLGLLFVCEKCEAAFDGEGADENRQS